MITKMIKRASYITLAFLMTLTFSIGILGHHNQAHAGDVHGKPGGFDITNISRTDTGKTLKNSPSKSIPGRGAKVCKAKYGTLKNNKKYTYTYDNYVNQVHIQSYKGKVGNFKCK
ncbi:hypothetical protein [Staphylococcus haemolyticus]|uniref:hypothetical protein n=1 Tax=Staphylococcus haemolyticus TaxID=1283 RepID=UPI002ACE6B0C|nr:hypothetical protein [Staphylococcus haemolyticus]